MAVMTPVMIQTTSAKPTELAFSITPFGLTKIPEPMMLPGDLEGEKCIRFKVLLPILKVLKRHVEKISSDTFKKKNTQDTLRVIQLVVNCTINQPSVLKHRLMKN